jgi:hypothetical protein
MNCDKQWQAAYMDATASGLGQQHKNIVSYLQMFENKETGLCYPSVKTLARMVGCSERTLQRGIRFLEQKEILESVGIKTGGRGHATPYRIHPEKWISDKPLKGDSIVTPFNSGKGDKPGPERVTNSCERVTKTPLKGDTAVTPEESKEYKREQEHSHSIR